MPTPHMQLDLPEVGATPGPEWAQKVNAAFERVDEFGAPITPDRLNISGDLDVQGNDLTEVRSVRLEGQPAPLAGPADLRAVFVVNSDLYYRDGNGTTIRLTEGGQPAGGGGGSSNVWASVTVASNHTVQPSDAYVALNVNTTSARSITLPAAASVAAGRLYAIKDVSGQSETNPITLGRSGADTIDGATSQSLSMNHGMWLVKGDGASSWHLMRPSPGFLTKASLTLGTTVLSTSSLSIGSSLLSSGSLVVGSNTLGDAGLRVGNGRGVYARNSLNDGDIQLVASSGNDVHLGEQAGIVRLRTDAVSVGENPATAGNVRLPANASIYALTDDGNANVRLIGTNEQDETIVPPLRYSTAQAHSVVQRVPIGNIGHVSGTAWAVNTAGQFSMLSQGAGAQHDFVILDPPNGATLDSITMTYNPGGSSRSPATRLGVYVYRIPTTGGYVEGGGDDDDSLISSSALSTSTPAQVAAYSFPASIRTHTFTCDTSNVIDTDRYAYIVRVKSESGASSSGTVNTVHAFKFNYTLARVGLA